MPKPPAKPKPALPTPDAGAFDRTLAQSQAEKRRTEQAHARMRQALVEEPAKRGEDPYELLAKAITRLLRS